jgi:hypothetical protein
MNIKCTVWLIRLLKYYPIIYSLEVLLVVTLSSLGIEISNWVYCLTGACAYTLLICFISSFVFKFCAWYRVLCVSSMIYLILEWIDNNIININNYFYISQLIIMLGLIISLIIYLHGKAIDKRNNKGSKETY